MSTNPRLLEGGAAPQPDVRDRVIKSLEDDVRDLNEQLATALRERDAQQAEIIRAVAELRRQLSPLYNALRMVFGEIDAIAPGDVSAAYGVQSAPSNAKWDAVKQRLQPRHREAVDILLLQGRMKRTQLANAMKMRYDSCIKNVVGPLMRQGWIVDNGGDLSVKEL